MIQFYAHERADDCDVTRDHDMLLFQWGTYGWGQGEKFEIDVVHQVVLPDESDDDALCREERPERVFDVARAHGCHSSSSAET